jgi:hypothetical protein
MSGAIVNMSIIVFRSVSSGLALIRSQAVSGRFLVATTSSRGHSCKSKRLHALCHHAVHHSRHCVEAGRWTRNYRFIIISLLMSPLLGHRPSLWITHKENGS